MKRVVHIAHSFEQAEEWDIRQQVEMTPNERMAAAKALIDRVYGTKTKDIRKTGVYHRSIAILSGRRGSPPSSTSP